MKKLLTIFIFVASLMSYSQSEYADSLITVAMDELKEVPEYECDIEIDLDVKFINIDKRKGKVFFYPPDSIRYKIKGFAFLPKKGYSGHANSVTESQDYVALHLGNETVHGQKCEIVKIVPNDIESDVVLGQFWIDSQNRIHKMTIVTRKEGNYNIDLEYGDLKYPVPKKATINFDVKEVKLPKRMTGDLEAEEEEIDPKKEKKRKKGSITIVYKDYTFKE